MLQIDQYRIIRLLGKGSTGEVYAATDGLRSVAIKWYMPGLIQLPDSEWTTLRQIQHPNIVQAIERGDYQGRPYLVMEYVEGLPLNAIPPDTLLPEQINSIALQLALGIQCAHSKQLIHRDIKPENILITPDLTVKILDFGVAAPVTFDPNIRLVEGSYAYMAPEQLTGKINLQNDIWAFGVTLYEWLTGSHPYPSGTLEDLSRQIMLLDVEYAHHLNPGVPPGVSWVLKKCLQGNLRRRYATFEEISADLTLVSTTGRWWDQPFDLAPVQKFIRQNFSLSTRLIVFLGTLLSVVCLGYFLYVILRAFPNIEDVGSLNILGAVLILSGIFTVAFWQYNQVNRLGLNEPESIQKFEFFLPASQFIKIVKKRIGAAGYKEWNDKLISYYFKTNQKQVAQRLARKMLRYDANNVKALSLLALQQFANHKQAEAREFCQRILAVNPDDASSVFFTRMLDAQVDPPTTANAAATEIMATQKRETPILIAQEDAPITSLERAVAEQGIARIPVQIVLENFIPIKAKGDLILHEKFLNLVIDEIDDEHLFWVSQKIKPLHSGANQNFQINAGKLAYLRTLTSPVLNAKRELTNEGPIGDIQQAAKSFITGLNRIVESKEKGRLKSDAGLSYTIPYNRIHRLAFGGQIIETNDFGLINFEIQNSANRENFLQFILKRWQKSNQIQTPNAGIFFRVLVLGLFMLSISPFILFALYKLILFINSKFGSPVEAFLIILVSVGVTLLALRKSLKHMWQEIRSQVYYVLRLVKYYIAPVRNENWLKQEERDPYLECYRLLFQHTMVGGGKKQERLNKEITTVTPFTINRTEKWIKCNDLKNIPFETVSRIVIQPDELGVFVGQEKYCQVKLTPDEFRNYFPQLFDVFQYKIHLGY